MGPRRGRGSTRVAFPGPARLPLVCLSVCPPQFGFLSAVTIGRLFILYLLYILLTHLLFIIMNTVSISGFLTLDRFSNIHRNASRWPSRF